MFKKTGFYPGDILLPKNSDMNKWAVVACDQFTSQPEYWEKVEKFTENAPSTLNLVFPEIYLSDDNSERINKINSSMHKYLKEEIFCTYENSFIYVQRNINGKIREGLVGIVDLEEYDYSQSSKALIRATEGTVQERIPPRVKIRENAPLELPHVMLLIDDDKNLLFSAIEKGEKVYDFDLMENSGNIKGFIVKPTQKIADALNALYEKGGKNPLLFAVGDGNHSLATAKTCYENIKKTYRGDLTKLPARYALVEVVNIHSEALEFEPIHRVLFDVDPENVIEELKKYYNTCETPSENAQKIIYTVKGTEKELYITNPSNALAVGTLQKFLDLYLEEKGGKIDYIHGDDVVRNLSAKDNSIGFILDAMEKSQLFTGVSKDGPLPRKTFSMGEAWEKRFYIEARKITE